MIAILVAILLAALAYWVCIVIGLPSIVAIIAAVLVLLTGVGAGSGMGRGVGGGGGGGFGRRRGTRI